MFESSTLSGYEARKRCKLLVPGSSAGTECHLSHCGLPSRIMAIQCMQHSWKLQRQGVTAHRASIQVKVGRVAVDTHGPSDTTAEHSLRSAAEFCPQKGRERESA